MVHLLTGDFTSELLVALGEDTGEDEDWLLGPASGGEDTLAMAATLKASGVSTLKETAASLRDR
jgi:hypothetical protein